MRKRTILTFLAATAVAASALVAPAAFTPAAAQASFNMNLSVPFAAPMPFIGVVPAPRPVYAWGEGWRHWEGEHRAWERDHRWREERRDFDRRRSYDHHYWR